MIEFFQSYGIWFLGGGFVVFMLWMHGGGHSMGGKSKPNGDDQNPSETAVGGPPADRPRGHH